MPKEQKKPLRAFLDNRESRQTRILARENKLTREAAIKGDYVGTIYHSWRGADAHLNLSFWSFLGCVSDKEFTGAGIFLFHLLTHSAFDANYLRHAL